MSPDGPYVLVRHALEADETGPVARRYYLAQGGSSSPAHERWTDLDRAKQYHREAEADNARQMLFEVHGESAKAMEVVPLRVAKAFEGIGS